IDKHLGQVEAVETGQILMKITEYLQEHLAQVKHVWLSLQSGYFNEDARSDESDIPDSNTTMHLLSFKLVTRVLEKMSEGFLSTRQVTMLRKVDNKVVHKLF
ncbi:MAG: hypothetical protein ACKPKO_58225, partial [Candidatus Fonsibacter sp.]